MAHVIERSFNRVSIFVGENVRIDKLLLDRKQQIESPLLRVLWPSLDTLQDTAKSFGFHDSAPSSRLAGGGLAERRLRGGEPRDRHAERRARNIVEPDLVAERDRGGGAPGPAASFELCVRAGLW